MGDLSEADTSQRVGTAPLLVLSGAWPGLANVISTGRCLEGDACISDVSDPSRGPRSGMNPGQPPRPKWDQETQRSELSYKRGSQLLVSESVCAEMRAHLQGPWRGSSFLP